MLVSNLDQTKTNHGRTLSDGWLAAQGFSVPSGGDDYTLTSIEIVFRGAASSTINQLAVSVWSADSSGRPASSLHTLTNPASIDAGIAASFTAPAGATLVPGNTYVVVADWNQATAYVWEGTTSDDEDATSTTGWTIANMARSRTRMAVSWDPVAHSLLLGVNGTPPLTAPAAPTTFSVAPGNAQVVLAWKAPAADSGVTRHEFRYKTTGDYPTSWTEIANSAPAEANEDSFTVTSLTNEVAHTFELRAVNAGGNGDAATAGPVTPTPGICDRTQQVQDEILSELSGVSDCAAVTVADLATVPRLFLESKSITSLKAGDFAGLTALTSIYLGENQIGALPADLFSGLTSLWQIEMTGSGVTSLHADAFSGLPALTTLVLGLQQFARLASGEPVLRAHEAAYAPAERHRA